MAQAELEKAKAKFEAPEEASCNDAAAICVRLNNVAAVELMLAVLRTWDDRGSGYLPQPHYRDVVWGALGKITDPYARKRVETELASNKQSAWTRQWCAELLGIYGDADFGDSLLKALNDREVGIARAAALALGKCKYQPALKALLTAARDKDYILRTNALDSLMLIDPTANKPVLLKSLKDKDGGVRCALLAIAARTLPDDAESLSTAAITDEDWRVRMQAADNFATIRTKSSVDALIKLLGDGRPAVAARAMRRLQELTGQKHLSRGTWEAWWRDNRETFAFPDAAAKAEPRGGSTVAYHGVELASDRVAFLIDVSAAMNETLKSKSSSKQSAALEELEVVLTKLQGRLSFNIFCYAEDTRAFGEKGPVELSARAQKKALEFVQETPQGDKKDIWRALTAVLEDPELDTAFLLSSGEPDIGTYVHWNRVTWQLADLNRFHKVTFHTIAYTDNDWFQQQLEKIAEVTGGEFRVFE
ncbi:MAG: HEAT repeat domain-containing protein [Planctomycetota bacterium]